MLAHGAGVALDDFGTGFASLSMLRRCLLSRLKIGRGSDRSDAVTVEAVLALGRGLGPGVVAEGVKTEAQDYL